MNNIPPNRCDLGDHKCRCSMKYSSISSFYALAPYWIGLISCRSIKILLGGRNSVVMYYHPLSEDLLICVSIIPTICGRKKSTDAESRQQPIGCKITSPRTTRVNFNHNISSSIHAPFRLDLLPVMCVHPY